MRAGTWTAKIPTVAAPIQARTHFLPRDWKIAQSVTDRPVKITIPGPLTIADTIADAYYGDKKTLGAALAEAINAEARALANDLTLLERFKTTQVILGVIAIAQSRVEPVGEIEARLSEALQHIDPARLIAAPDCGLGLLGRSTVIAKLSNLVTAAKAVL